MEVTAFFEGEAGFMECADYERYRMITMMIRYDLMACILLVGVPLGWEQQEEPAPTMGQVWSR
jgi:hypothetical protein